MQTLAETKYNCQFLNVEELNEIEQEFINALENDDVPTVERMLSSNEIPIIQHKIQRIPISAWIVRSLSPNMIRMAVRNYPNVFLGSCKPFEELIQCLRGAGRGTRYWISTGGTITCESRAHSRIFDTFALFIDLHQVNNSSMPTRLMELIFKNIDESSPSIFTRACRMGKAEMVEKSLDLITDDTRKQLRAEWFVVHNAGTRKLNLFHYADDLPVDLIRAIIDRLPFSKSLINGEGTTSDDLPLLRVGASNPRNSAAIARLYVLHGGAQVDPLNHRGSTPLYEVIEEGNLEMVECFLRMGAQTDIVDREGDTALSLALRFGHTTARDALGISSRMVELLLAFGVDLGKEACLPPTSVLSDPNRNARSHRYHFCILGDLRDSNTMNSMSRLCRKAIRRRLGPNADEKIKEMAETELPRHLKSYLLVENEPSVLDELRQ